MSVAFNGSSFIKTTTAPITGAPFTISLWSKATSALNTGIVFEINNDSLSQRYTLAYSANTIEFYGSDGTNASSAIGSNTSTDWIHLCAVSSAPNSRLLYINGILRGSNTLNIVPLSLSSAMIASRADGGFGFSGSVAEIGVYNTALTTSEIAGLVSGFSPSMIATSNLKMYIPLIRNIQNEINPTTLTTTGSPTVDTHIRIYK